ncbi:MAG: hypothetical protein VX438_17520 [Planctomycetota bacterium]|jgi:hypothetical protein|nr:hypothetical protein [Planctomycetota bacterium]
MFQIDEPVDYQRIQQFATQAANISNRLSTELADNYSGDQTDDFYLGLLTGFAHSLSITQSQEFSAMDKESLLGAIVAFVADRIAKRGF